MKTKIKIPKSYKPDEREAIATDIIEKIVNRTKSGKDKDGKDFKQYTIEYKKSLNYKIAGKRGKPNLTLSGDMLADLQLLSHKNGEIVLGYEKGTLSNDIAEGNILGTYGKKTPTGKARDFLGIEEKELNKVLTLYPVENKEDRRQRVDAIKEIISGADKIAARIFIDELED